VTQLKVKIETIRRIERIAGQHIIRGGDKIINQALDVMQKRIVELENDS